MNMKNKFSFQKRLNHRMLIILCLTTFLLQGCASLMLSISNQEFKENNLRHVEFSRPTTVMADYLGMKDNAYIYRVYDSKNQAVYFSLPAENEKTVGVSLNHSGKKETSGPAAQFHFFIYENNQCQPNKDSAYPLKICINKNGYEYEYLYCYRDGCFSNISKKCIESKNAYCRRDEEDYFGLSNTDTFILGLRRAGYVITVPFDIVTLPITIIPIAIMIYMFKDFKPMHAGLYTGG